MGKIIRRAREQQEGMIILEATISVSTFLLFVLMIYGLISVFLAQNLIGHALVESTQSLALDSYATDKLTDTPSVGAGIRSILELVTEIAPDDPAFSSRERWYDRKSGATQEDWVAAAKERFVGYLAGGDQSKANEMLLTLRVKDGLDGLDFSESNIIGSDVYIRVSYEVEYLFNPFDLAVFSTSQQACSRMWGASLEEHTQSTIATAPGSEGSWIDSGAIEKDDPTSSSEP